MSGPAWCCPVNDAQIAGLLETCGQTVSEWWLLRHSETHISFVRQEHPSIPDADTGGWRLFCPRLEIRREGGVTVAMFENEGLLQAMGVDSEPGFIAEEKTMLLAGQRTPGVPSGYIDVRLPQVLGVEALPGAGSHDGGWELQTLVYSDAGTDTPCLTRYAIVRPRSEKEG